MKAVIFDQFGPPGVLKVVQLSDPRPAAGQPRISHDYPRGMDRRIGTLVADELAADPRPRA